MQRRTSSAFDLALGAEVAAARIEAALQMDPAIAAQWRAEVGVAEAVASIGLEDVRLSEPDLLIRISENSGSGIDARATEDALAIMRYIRAPGDVAGNPVEVLDRIARLSMRGEGDSDAIPGAELADIFDPCVGRAPIIEAMRAAADYAWRTDRRSPVAERMVFMAAEHASRTVNRRHGAIGQDTLRGLGGRFDADWICPPSVALSRLRFRIWSPSNPAMLRDLLEGIERVLSQELGRIIALRRWRERLEEVSRGRHGRSRLADAGEAFGIEPFMTSRILADRLGVTQRGAINLLDQLVAEGLIVELTRRRAARIWATPGLARILSSAGRHPRGGAQSRSISDPTPTSVDSPDLEDLPRTAPAAARTLREEGKVAIDKALADFDRVLGEVDAILERRR